MTGYAVRQAIRDVLGQFWSESFGQIYPALSQIERQGLVAREDTGRQGSSLNRITPAGEERLRERLAEPIRHVPPRNGLLLGLFLGRHLGVEACRSLVRQERCEAEAQLADLAGIRREIAAEDETAPDNPFWLLTVSAGEHAVRAGRALAALDTLDEAGPA